MAKTFFTSDLHLNHENIIKYCNRPFRDVNHMNYEIIRRINERVKPEDTLIIVGDFCFRNSAGGKPGEGGPESPQNWINQINGSKVFIRGNHDKNNRLNTKIQSLVVNLGLMDCFVVHDPRFYNPTFPVTIHGHVHNHWKMKLSNKNTILINVGVDMWNFYPIDIQEITAESIKYAKNYNLQFVDKQLKIIHPPNL